MPPSIAPHLGAEFQRYAPGEVLLRSLIEYAQAEGYTAFDFARGAEPSWAFADFADRRQVGPLHCWSRR